YLRPPPYPSPFPYTTLFRSRRSTAPGEKRIRVDAESRQERNLTVEEITEGVPPALEIAHCGVPHEELPRRPTRIDRGCLRQESRSEEHTSELQSRVELVCRL